MHSLAFALIAALLLTGPAQRAFGQPPPVATSTTSLNENAYAQARLQLVARHVTNRFCANEEISAGDEMFVAAELRRMMQDATNGLRSYSTAPFCCIKSNIQGTALYQMLTNMPKGALLHAHLSAIGRMDWVLTNVLTQPNCYVIWPETRSQKKGKLKFFSSDQAARGEDTNYQPVSAVARAYPNFVNELQELLTVSHEDLARGSLWSEFGYIFDRLDAFIRYKGVFTNYLYDAFNRLRDDHIYHVELRDALPGLFDLDNKRLKEDSGVRGLMAVRERMLNERPSFDCRVILTNLRWATNIAQDLARVLSLQRDSLFGEMVIGYDLIASEDDPKGATEAKVHEVLLPLRKAQESIKAYERSSDFAFYLHNGESAWADNENLFDSILLGTPRIGHGFNLFRYPTLYATLIASNMALEVCPISNQLLGLTPDLRIHPASGYLNAKIQCVLASDDPLLFGNDGLSYEFWEAVMAWNLDLAAIKKLVRNSIRHSGLNQRRKNDLETVWRRQWYDFIARQKQALQAKSNKRTNENQPDGRTSINQAQQ